MGYDTNRLASNDLRQRFTANSIEAKLSSNPAQQRHNIHNVAAIQPNGNISLRPKAGLLGNAQSPQEVGGLSGAFAMMPTMVQESPVLATKTIETAQVAPADGSAERIATIIRQITNLLPDWGGAQFTLSAAEDLLLKNNFTLLSDWLGDFNLIAEQIDSNLILVQGANVGLGAILHKLVAEEQYIVDEQSGDSDFKAKFNAIDPVREILEQVYQINSTFISDFLGGFGEVRGAILDAMRRINRQRGNDIELGVKGARLIGISATDEAALDSKIRARLPKTKEPDKHAAKRNNCELLKSGLDFLNAKELNVAAIPVDDILKKAEACISDFGNELRDIMHSLNLEKIEILGQLVPALKAGAAKIRSARNWQGIDLRELPGAMDAVALARKSLGC